MEFPPLRRSTVADQVFAHLRDAILTGELAAGDALPAERDLAARFAVNRHALREAIKRLEQVQLVRVSQGGHTRVQDWRTHAGLDLTTQLAHAGDRLAVATLTRDVLEMRAGTGADAARLCAERADDATRAAIVAEAQAYARTGADLDRLDEANLRLWRRIVEGSGNIAYLLAFNSLVGQTLAVAPVPVGRRTAELLDVAGHRLLARLIAERRPQQAYRQARQLLDRSLDAAEPADPAGTAPPPATEASP